MSTNEYPIFPKPISNFSVSHSQLPLTVFHSVLKKPFKNTQVFLVDGSAESVGFIFFPLPFVNSTILDAISSNSMLLLRFNIVLSRIFTIFGHIQTQIKFNFPNLLQLVDIDSSELPPHLDNDRAMTLWLLLQSLLNVCFRVGDSPEFKFII